MVFINFFSKKNIKPVTAIIGVLLTCLILCPSITRAKETGPKVTKLSGITILDLQTAQQLALKENPDLEAARARVEQARARVQQAIAAWWPSVDLLAGAQKERLSENVFAYNQAIAGLLGAETTQTSDTFNIGARTTWLLFDGFARNFKQKQAQFGEQVYRAGVTNAQRLLVQSVTKAFLNAQLAQTNVDIALADKAFYTRQLEDAQNRYNVGAGKWGDVLNIKVQLNSAKSSHIYNQRDFEAATYGLAALLGQPEAKLPTEVHLQPLDRKMKIVHMHKSADELIEQAWESRPDLLQLAMQVEQSEAGTKLAKAPFYPTLQLEGAVTGTRDDDIEFSGNDYGNLVSLNLAWDLFSGGEDKARLVEARQAKRESRYAYYNLRNQIASEVRQAIAMLEAAEEQVRLNRESVSLVKENRDLAKDEYMAGESSLVRLNEAQRDLTKTYGRLAQALVAYKRAKQNLDSATGTNLKGLIMQQEQKK